MGNDQDINEPKWIILKYAERAEHMHGLLRQVGSLCSSQVSFLSILYVANRHALSAFH